MRTLPVNSLVLRWGWLGPSGRSDPCLCRRRGALAAGAVADPQAHLALQQSYPCVLSALTYRSFILRSPHCSALRPLGTPRHRGPRARPCLTSRPRTRLPLPSAGLRLPCRVEGWEWGGGTARRRPGPAAAAAAGSRQIRVSWRELTCEPARAAGPSRGAAPARLAALPLPPPPQPSATAAGER